MVCECVVVWLLAAHPCKANLSHLHVGSAHDEVTMTNFTIPITWPSKACDHCVLRLAYVSNNPDEAVPSMLIRLGWLVDCLCRLLLLLLLFSL